jgi:hypothetical protein
VKGAGGPRARKVLSPDEGEAVEFGGLGMRFMIDGAHSEGNFALVEHPIGPRVLAAPMHTHRHEDEYTYVLEGEIGVQEKYGLEMDMGSIPTLTELHGLVTGEPPA